VFRVEQGDKKEERTRDAVKLKTDDIFNLPKISGEAWIRIALWWWLELTRRRREWNACELVVSSLLRD
jgi:hypothetical protein